MGTLECYMSRMASLYSVPYEWSAGLGRVLVSVYVCESVGAPWPLSEGKIRWDGCRENHVEASHVSSVYRLTGTRLIGRVLR